VENTIPRILLVKCYIDHRPLVVKLFATSGVTQAFLVLCQGLTILGSDAKKSQQYVVCKLSRFVSNPGDAHWQALERVLRYLKGASSYGIHYTEYPIDGP